MSQRLNEYLAREAGDYLEQLVELLRSSGSPDPQTLHRLARGVRGSAQMAGAASVAPVAARLEEAARSLAAGSDAWSDDHRARLLGAARELQRLLAAPDDVVPISALFHDDDGPHVLSRPAALESAQAPEPEPAEDADADDGIVPVESLLLRGDDALREALALRPRLEELLGSAEPAAAAALLDELFDLVRLAQTEDRPAA